MQAIRREGGRMSLSRLIFRVMKTQLLVTDEFLLHEVMAEEEGELLELVDARLIVGSTVFCSQYCHEDWIEIIGRSPVSEAFISRVSSSSYVFRMDSSEDMRMLGSAIIWPIGRPLRLRRTTARGGN